MGSRFRDHTTDSRDTDFYQNISVDWVRKYTLIRKRKNKILVHTGIFNFYLGLHTFCLTYTLVYIFYAEKYLGPNLVN